jgi:hypothetical protein
MHVHLPMWKDLDSVAYPPNRRRWGTPSTPEAIHEVHLVDPFLGRRRMNMYIPNGTSATELPTVTAWVKSQFSAAGNCVELAALDGGAIAVRNSRDPEGPALIYTRAEIDAFVRGAAAGDFDFAR